MCYASKSPGINIWGPGNEKSPEKHGVYSDGALNLRNQIQYTLIEHFHSYTLLEDLFLIPEVRSGLYIASHLLISFCSIC